MARSWGTDSSLCRSFNAKGECTSIPQVAQPLPYWHIAFARYQDA